jgi:hypothetical protein
MARRELKSPGTADDLLREQPRFANARTIDCASLPVAHGAYSVFTIFQPSVVVNTGLKLPLSPGGFGDKGSVFNRWRHVVWTEKGGFLWRKCSAIGAEPEGQAKRTVQSSGGARRSADAVVGPYPKVGQSAYRGRTRRSNTKKPP